MLSRSVNDAHEERPGVHIYNCRQCTDSRFEQFGSSRTSTVSADAVDSCEVCFVAPRDARFALVPCGHQRFCESCANAVHDQSRGCSLCRTPITLVLRLY